MDQKPFDVAKKMKCGLDDLNYVFVELHSPESGRWLRIRLERATVVTLIDDLRGTLRLQNSRAIAVGAQKPEAEG